METIQNYSEMGSDQARAAIGEGLGPKQVCFTVLKRCFWGQKEQFKALGKNKFNKMYGGHHLRAAVSKSVRRGAHIADDDDMKFIS